jgi:hypothetical protein
MTGSSERLCLNSAMGNGRNDLTMVSVHGGYNRERSYHRIEYEKGIRWMPWHQEAMKDVARCEKPWGAASRR